MRACAGILLLLGACHPGSGGLAEVPAAIESYPRLSVLFWGAITIPAAADNIGRENGLVILSEANYIVEPAAHRPDAEIFVSINAKSVWSKPSQYYPAVAEALAAALAMDALMKRADGTIVLGWPGTWNIDLTHPAFREAFAEIIARLILSRPEVAGVFMDECHSDIYENPAGDVELYAGGPVRVALTKAEAQEAWQAATTALLGSIESRSGKRIMMNGTMPLTAAAKGRYLQQFNSFYPDTVIERFLRDAALVQRGRRDFLLHGSYGGLPGFLNDTTQLTDAELLAMKVFLGTVSWLPAAQEPDYRRFVDYSTAFASLVDAAVQVDDNRFVSPWNGAARSSFAAGSFGRPLEYVKGTSEVPVLEQVGEGYIRQFERAEVVVNTSVSQSLVYRNTTIAPQSATVFWR